MLPPLGAPGGGEYFSFPANFASPPSLDLFLFTPLFKGSTKGAPPTTLKLSYTPVIIITKDIPNQVESIAKASCT